VVQQIAPLVELPSDPCALVTSDQVAAATSSNVLSSRQLSDSDLKVPGPPYPCSFETDGRFGHVGVVSVPNDPQGLTDLLNKDPLSREIVSGVGDGAFISSGSEIVVALGDGYYSMGMQHGAGSEAASPLRRLAEDALRSLQSGGSENGSPTPTPDGFFLAPHLAGGLGWDSVSSEPIPAARRGGTTAWASTGPISQEDVQLRAAIPPSTIAQLPQDGIVVTVEVVPSAFEDDSVPFPYADLSFDLAAATPRGPEAEEPTGDYSVLQTENADAATLVRVYFGARNPSPELVARAQSELDTLQLPPTCTTGGPGSYAVSVSSTTASSGDVLTLTGNVPFQREDGSFDESGNGQMVAWWNADPKDWPYLTSDLPTPSPAVEGQGILELGQASMDTCTFSIPFAVPQSAPGAYPVVVLQEGGGGATLEGSVTIHVTG
jgi:hypothetical protein